MPTYEFECTNGHKFDQFFRKIADAASELPCPTCGASAIRKISGGLGLHFKGSGFYITDYGKGGKKTESSGGSDGGGGTSDGAAKGGSGGTTSDAKPAAPEKKSDTKSTPKE